MLTYIHLALLALSIWNEAEPARKAEKRKAMDLLRKGIRERNPSYVTAAFDRVRRMNRTTLVLPLLFFLFLASGCITQPVLHPIEADIFPIPAGVQCIEVEKDGWFISDFYLEEIMEVKIP